jgi:hypothetical protein
VSGWDGKRHNGSWSLHAFTYKIGAFWKLGMKVFWAV